MLIDSINKNNDPTGNPAWYVTVTDNTNTEKPTYRYKSPGVGLTYYDNTTKTSIEIPNCKTHMHRTNREERFIYQLVQQFPEYHQQYQENYMHHALEFWRNHDNGQSLPMLDPLLQFPYEALKNK